MAIDETKIAELVSQVLKEICNGFGNGENPYPDEEKPDEDTPEISIPEESIPEESQKPTPETLSYAQQIVNLVNQERAKAGLSVLTMDEDITAAANLPAVLILRSGFQNLPLIYCTIKSISGHTVQVSLAR